MSNTLPDSYAARVKDERDSWKAVHRLAVELYDVSAGLAHIGGDTPFDGVISAVWTDLLRLHGEAPHLGATAHLSGDMGTVDAPRVRKPIKTKVRIAVYRRDDYTCQHCGTTDDLTLDHIIPWSKGGSDDAENLQTLCGPCNFRKGAR